MTWLWYGITSGVGWCVVGGLSTVFDGDTDGIIYGFDEVMEIVFSDKYFYFCSDGKLEGIVALVRDKINYFRRICVAGVLVTGFYWDSEVITFVID